MVVNSVFENAKPKIDDQNVKDYVVVSQLY